MKVMNDTGLAHFWAALKTLLQGKQDTLTPGTGIDITNNVISTTGGGGGGITFQKIIPGNITLISSYANNATFTQASGTPTKSYYTWIPEDLNIIGLQSSGTTYYTVKKLYNATEGMDRVYLRFRIGSTNNYIEGYYTRFSHPDSLSYGFKAENADTAPIFGLAYSTQYSSVLCIGNADLSSQILNVTISTISANSKADTTNSYNLSTVTLGDGLNINNNTLIIEYSNVEEGTY